MTPEQIERLLEAMQSACDVPIVYSEPLARLSMALAAAQDAIADLDQDDPLLPLIVAAETVATKWCFWPSDTYGSNLATIDPGNVEALIEALDDYRTAQREREAE